MIVDLLILLILVSLWVGFYQLFKQQGRILLRLDQLEHLPPAGRADIPKLEQEVDQPGLPVGSDFPGFVFPDLVNKPTTLENFRGRRVLLVNWNFECGFCDSIAPHLARLQTDFEKRDVHLVLLADGEARANQGGAAEYGLRCPILLMPEKEEGAPFDEEGTPTAYLIDEKGRVATPVARGADRVLALAIEVADPQSEPAKRAGNMDEDIELGAAHSASEESRPHRLNLSRFLVKHDIGLGDLVKRVTAALGIKTCVGCEKRAAVLNRWLILSGINGKGLRAGTPAPAFCLPDLDGRITSLQEYRGRRLLLVFTDPRCGPCDDLAPHLMRLYQEHVGNGMGVLLIGRGSAEENRCKAQRFGYQFPVLLQDKKWKVSSDYGVLATPAAFLVGEEGVITRDAAVGSTAVLELLGDGQISQKEDDNERADR